jgi:membrane protein implicated in regulation of membrane protease activity
MLREEKGMEQVKGQVTPARGHKVWILAILGLVCIGLEIVVHLYFRTAVGYTHIFYILLVLSALWYYHKALIIAGGLVCATLATSLFVGDLTWATILRVAMFLIITWIVATISEERDSARRTLQEQKDEIERKHFALVGYISEAANRMKNPLEMLRDNLASMRMQVDQGLDTDELKMMLSVQITHLEQIIENFREINRGIVEERDEIPETFREFLTW